MKTIKENKETPLEFSISLTRMALQISLESDHDSPTPNLLPPSSDLATSEKMDQNNITAALEEQFCKEADVVISESLALPAAVEESGRERLKQHRKAVAGRVWIPEKWGKEELLKDWIDSSAFEASIFPSGNIVSAHSSARMALIREGKRSANNDDSAAAAIGGGLRILNRC